MKSDKSASSDECASLRQWLAGLPGHVDYEHDDDTVSRQEFLKCIIQLTDPQSVAVVYLQDHDKLDSFLTLAYAAGVPRNELTLPRRINLSSPDDVNFRSIEIKELNHFASVRGFGTPLIYVLSEFRHPLPSNKVVLGANDVGIAVVFLTSSVTASSLMKTQLQIAWRLFSAEAARSRHQRLSLAIRKMLESISDLASMEALCGILIRYCRSQSVYLYERRGTHYTVVGESHYDSRRLAKMHDDVEVRDLSDILKQGEILRSHVYPKRLPKKLDNVVNASAWMLLPCFTEAVNILSGTPTKYPQYLLFLVDKENTEYLGRDYSFTDLTIGQSLVSLLSNHVPYMGLSEKLNEVLKELDAQPLEEFKLSWFSNLAMHFLPGLFALGVFPDFPSGDTSGFSPQPFSISSESFRSADSPRANESCLATSNDTHRALNCMIFRIATEYRSEQRLLFAFVDQYIQNAQLQILNVLVEYARSVFNVTDFREYHNSTQAQIRHVIRGSLSAAISELSLLENRIRVFAGVPTKLSRLLETPTMRDSMSDSLLWLNEAYSLADAPRYLLDSFGNSSVRWSDVNPVDVVRSVLAISRGEIRRRGLRVEFSPDTKVQSRIISADPEFIKIVIFNLIDNAVKYSFQDKYLKIELSYIDNKRWRFEVENIGVPISPVDRKKIFYPWVRSFRQYLASRRPGTGLGLAVSTRILKAHDEGMIFDFTSDLIDEKPATGRTTFFFELDLKGKGEVTS